MATKSVWLACLDGHGPAMSESWLLVLRCPSFSTAFPTRRAAQALSADRHGNELRVLRTALGFIANQRGLLRFFDGPKFLVLHTDFNDNRRSEFQKTSFQTFLVAYPYFMVKNAPAFRQRCAKIFW